jgi:2-oxo-hept-3-ene-1,7-dioate hydratase
MNAALTASQCAALARELDQAEAKRAQVEQFSRRHPGMIVDDSYAVQRAWVDLQLRAGRRRIGRKIGLTSRAMQLASQITEPDHGVMLDSMLLADGGEIVANRYIVPRLEVEFAFVLGKSLQGPGVTMLDVLRATEYVMPALELIDARIEQFDRATRQPRTVRGYGMKRVTGRAPPSTPSSRFARGWREVAGA